MQLFRAKCYCRRAKFQGLVRFEIIVQQGFEGRERILILFFTGNELPVVETDAIVQQQFDGRSDNGIAVLSVAPSISSSIFIMQSITV